MAIVPRSGGRSVDRSNLGSTSGGVSGLTPDAFGGVGASSLVKDGQFMQQLADQEAKDRDWETDLPPLLGTIAILN